MSSTTISCTPACIVLHGLTNLQQHRPVPGKGNTFIYDAIFTCGDASVDDGVGSFRCYVGQDKSKKADDVYELEAKIIAFKPGRNVNSDKYNNDEINLLGEIEKARNKLHMQPLTIDNEADLDDIIHISGAGTVCTRNTDPPEFMIYATQYVDGGTDDIAVRACLSNNPKWPDPVRRLPDVKSIVGFCGILLQRFEPYTPPMKPQTTCVVIALKDIAYIYKPKDQEDKGTTLQKKTNERKLNMHDRIKARNRATRQQSPYNSQTASSPSTSQKTLGKRKAQTSQEEVNEEL
ncbi:hypothetical protein EDB85DRAFT_1886563 [Lactarius pseudohatsudake]|nr:hypothetical protein EDB85DRAFT_1886563 [Lactarius pseudohatsudake]